MNKKTLSVLLLIVIPLLILYQAIQIHSLNFFLSISALVVLIFPVYAFVRNKNQQVLSSFSDISFDPVTDIFFSLAFAFVILEFNPTNVIDDTGFLLRYLNNFSQGYFYRFNIADAPVYGISSFTYCIFTGFFCITHLLTPIQSIHFAQFVGLFFICFFIFKILRQLGVKSEYQLLAWVLIIDGSSKFLSAIIEGVETPLHIAIVLSAVYFFVKNKPKAMWLMLAVSVISKLDAVPLAVSIGLMYFYQNRKNLMHVSFSNSIYKNVLLFAVAPLIAWVIFSTLVFGSPLPQSAFAKIYFHAHPDNYWFPFIKYFIEGYHSALFFTFIILFSIHVFLVRKKRVGFTLNTLTFGISFISTMILYYIYNPEEQMDWYYALPDIFLVAQTTISIILLSEYFLLDKLKNVTIALTFLLAFTFFSPIAGTVVWIKNYLKNADGERVCIGNYIDDLTTENDTIISYHGLVSLPTRAYVIDMSGLNSKLATKYNCNLPKVVEIFKPDYAIYCGTDSFVNVMDASGYSLIKSYYNITDYNWPAWRLFKRTSKNELSTRLISPSDSSIVKGRITRAFKGLFIYGKEITIKLPDDSLLYSVNFGIKRGKAPFEMSLTVAGDDNATLEERKIKINPQIESDADTSVDFLRSKEIVWNCPEKFATIKGKAITINFLTEEVDEIMSPVFLLRRK